MIIVCAGTLLIRTVGGFFLEWSMAFSVPWPTTLKLKSGPGSRCLVSVPRWGDSLWVRVCPS